MFFVFQVKLTQQASLKAFVYIPVYGQKDVKTQNTHLSWEFRSAASNSSLPALLSVVPARNQSEIDRLLLESVFRLSDPFYSLVLALAV